MTIFRLPSWEVVYIQWMQPINSNSFIICLFVDRANVKRLVAQITYTSCTICVLPLRSLFKWTMICTILQCQHFLKENDFDFVSFSQHDLASHWFWFRSSVDKYWRRLICCCYFFHSLFSSLLVVVEELDGKSLTMSCCPCINWYLTLGQFFFFFIFWVHSFLTCWYLTIGQFFLLLHILSS